MSRPRLGATFLLAFASLVVLVVAFTAPASGAPAASHSVGCALLADSPGPLPSEHQTVIVVSVPATAILRVGWDGHMAAAMTNTGCPPRSGDDIFLMWPDRTITPCPALAADAVRWEGSFDQPGEYVPQSAHVSCS